MAQIDVLLDDTVIVIWRDGVLSGDPMYVADVRIEAAVMDGARLGPPEGPFSEDDHLSTPLGFSIIATRILPEDIVFRGDVPAPREMRDETGEYLL